MDDVISRQKALNVIERMRAYIGHNMERAVGAAFIEILDDVGEDIGQLPSAQPEQTDCGYCHEDSDGYVKPIEKNCHAFIRFGMDGWELSLKAKGWHGSAKIKYCPICGRSLTHE